MPSIIVLIGFVGCSNQSEMTIDTPGGKVKLQKTTVDPRPQQITTVTGDELERLQGLVEQGPGFVKSYLPDVGEPHLSDYDEAFRIWQSSKSKQYSKEQVIEILGGMLGNQCVTDLGMEWVTVSDEYGTDYAVRGKSVEVMAFPFESVSKRIEKNENGFLNNIYHAIKRMMESGEYKTRNPDEGTKEPPLSESDGHKDRQ